MNASILAADFSSSESRNSRAGTLPFGNATYAMLNSPFTRLQTIALLRYRCQGSAMRLERLRSQNRTLKIEGCGTLPEFSAPPAYYYRGEAHLKIDPQM